MKSRVAALIFASCCVVMPSWAAIPLITPIAIPAVKQNALDYLPSGKGDQPMFTPAVQQSLAQRALRHFLAPWTTQTINPRGLNRVQRSLLAYYGAPGRHYAYNFHTLDRQWVAQVAQDMQSPTWNNSRAAIVVNNTALRALPTDLPIYSNFRAAGAGYPFDLIQISSEWVGQPVAVLKLTQDRAWALVDDGDAQGWVKATDIAMVPADDLIDASAAFAAMTVDNQPIKDNNGNFLFYSRIGMLFPYKDGKIRVPLRDPQGMADFQWIKVSEEQVQPYPMTATPRRIARLINQMLGQPYAWGGLYNLRDCSLTMKHLLLPFGLALPRNSQAQADAGQKIMLKGLSDQAKQALIAAKGVPFMTLLHMHGHIVLYLGSWRGDGMIFHNKWGIITRDREGNVGRAVLGKAHIAPLSFGNQVPNAAITFIQDVDSMTLLP